MAVTALSLRSQQEVLEVKCEPMDEEAPQGELGILSVNSLRRSVSQVMDGKSLTGDDDTWDPNISGHDSGMVRDPQTLLNYIISDNAPTTVTHRVHWVLLIQSIFKTCFPSCTRMYQKGGSVGILEVRVIQ